MTERILDVDALLKILEDDVKIMLKHIDNVSDDYEKQNLQGYVDGVLFCKETVENILGIKKISKPKDKFPF